jgi:dsDNA-binding SOS-regulon protein
LAVLAILCFAMLVSLCFMSARQGEWTDSKTFTSIDDAQRYRKFILETAKEYNASYSNVAISVASPPTVTFNIHLPSNSIFLLPQDTYFPYGRQTLSASDIWIGTAVVVAFFLVVSIIFLKDDWQGKLG